MKEEGKKGNTGMLSQEEKPQPLTLLMAIKHSWGPLTCEDFARQFYFRKCITRMDEEKEDEEQERKEEEGERNMANETFYTKQAQHPALGTRLV